MNNAPYKTLQAAVAVSDAMVDLENFITPTLEPVKVTPAPRKRRNKTDDRESGYSVLADYLAVVPAICCVTCREVLPHKYAFADHVCKQKHLSATIEPCYCGEENEFQVEIYELDVQDRLTSKFNDVKFHLTKDAADEAAKQVNGTAAAKRSGTQRQTKTKQVQTKTKETVDMSKKTQKYAGPIEIPSVQALLKRISKRSEKNPIKVKDFENQYQNRVARRLAAAGLVASEKREGVGLVFFGKPVKA